MKPSQKYIVIFATIFVAIIALYKVFKESPADQNNDVANSETSASTEQNPISPYLALSDMKGNTVVMDSSKLVFVNVWATWCGPCNAEMPSIQALYRRYKDHPKMAFYVVSDENPSTVHNFLQKKDYELPFYLFNGAYPPVLDGSAIPRTYMLRHGQVLAEQVGAINWNDPQVFEFIDKQLAL
ncbi:TlpA family protein disulfide reductase [Salmonirosea aquatica]|uniref:Redoxin family protein n=1 Tax=Salmonirosea aquatica TaxID=2654236 RepID=A0A7C9BAQ4_9BACT|nr:redoxin family protein [Cytophagaceae bacterium SJW1-29]